MFTYLKNHWIKVLVISLFFVIFMGRYQYKMPKRNFADFHAYYYTGERLLGGQTIYDVNGFRKDKMANFKYPPICALIFAALASIPERIAATTWFIFNFLLIILFMHFSGRLIFSGELTYIQKNWIYFWSLSLTSRFYMQNFDTGQVNFLMMTAIYLGMYAANKNKDSLGGLLIAFSILVKYMGAIFIPYFIYKKKIKFVMYIVCFLILFSLLPALFLGWERNMLLQSQYLSHLTRSSLDFYSLSDEANQSLLAMIIKFFSSYACRTHGYPGVNFIDLGDYYLGILTGGSCVLMYILSILSTKNNKTALLNNIDIGLLSVCVALFNPNAWSHAFIFLTFGYIVAIFYLIQNKFADKIVLFLVILSFVFHSFTASFFTRFWAKELFEIYSFVTIGAMVFFLALLKIKFWPKFFPLKDNQ